MRQKPFLALSGLAVAALSTGGFAPGPALETKPPIVKVQAAEPQTAAPQAPVPVPAVPQPEAPPLSPAEHQSIEDRLVFNRVLVDAAVLKNNYENFKRRKSKTPVSLSSFRNLELQLNAIAAADPANTQARDWA
ncbi:MAG: hypothetical protein V4661_03575, partial [Pseudomonadota bacterium]